MDGRIIKALVKARKNYGVYDTRKYRYRVTWQPDCEVYERIPLKYLDTIKAYDKNNWEYLGSSRVLSR